MNMIARAHESFDALPADVRARFGNDPGAFVEFCSDEKNLPAMREMGLAVKAVQEALVEAVVPPPGGDQGKGV